MWMKKRYASWEVEGQVQERIDRALAEGERLRLTNTARRRQRRHLFGRTLFRLAATLTWLSGRAATAWYSLRSRPSRRQEHREGGLEEPMPS
jgi:hypothetical protein